MEHALHDSTWRTAVSATLHCLTGCAIGEVLGMALATRWGWGNLASIVLAVALAFVFGAMIARGRGHAAVHQHHHAHG
jgi:hypothetical protein